jgi:hypothetical protein
MKTMLAVAKEWLSAERDRLAASGETVHTGHPAHIVEWLLEEVRRRTLTDAEREAVRFALKSLDWPLDGPQLAVVARTVGASCELPEHRMKATLRGLLERTSNG